MKRKCSGCAVFRIEDGELQFLLVTSSTNTGRWTFPKGGIEPNLSAQNSAIKEVYEEAGVNCEIVTSLGSYRYVKGGAIQEVEMFAARYTGDTDDWPEMELRKREWVKYNKAIKKLNEFLAPFVVDVFNYVTAWGLEVRATKRPTSKKASVALALEALE